MGLTAKLQILLSWGIYWDSILYYYFCKMGTTTLFALVVTMTGFGTFKHCYSYYHHHHHNYYHHHHFGKSNVKKDFPEEISEMFFKN